MSGREIAIGDIHGCSQALATVVELLVPTAVDRLIVLGDVVDRGPDSRGVIDRLLALREVCQVDVLMGNHEEMMLDVVIRKRPPADWLRFGGTDTLDSYNFSGDLACIPAAHVEFLQQSMDYVETETHFFVHANYDPQLPLDAQPSDLLRWTSLDLYLPGPHVSGKTAILGHTHDTGGELFVLPYLKCIDTWCYGRGWLTAIDVHSGQIWQADKTGRPRPQ